MTTLNTSSTIWISTLGNGSTTGNGYNPSLSGDGRFVVFQAFDLTPGDTNRNTDVLLRDTLTNTTTLLSTNTSGAVTTSVSIVADGGGGSISEDGRFVVFASRATDLVSGDTEGKLDVFIRDTQSGLTTRVSQNSVGTGGNADSNDAKISGDGRFVAFNSYAGNLTSSVFDNNNAQDVYVRDQLTGEIRAVSAFGISTGNVDSTLADISADGRFVAFSSTYGGFVSGDNNGANDVFVRDLVLGTTTRVSVGINGEGDDDAKSGRISDDGRFVAFTSSASNLVAGGTNSYQNVFLRDTVLGTTTLVSVGANGAQSNGTSFDVNDISADGRYVLFTSGASNLVAGDTNDTLDVFLRDTVLGTTTRLSVGPGGKELNDISDTAHFSADGNYVTFRSSASNIVPGLADVHYSNIFRIALTATNAADNLLGSDGADTINGLGGSDIINGGFGTDSMTGGAGNDTFYVDNIGDKVIEAAGQGYDTVIATASFALGATSEVEVLQTSSFINSTPINLTGSNTNNTLQGNNGNNVLNGGGGADIMSGYGGDDTYYVDNVGDKVDEYTSTGGTDRVYASVSYALAAGVQVEALYAQPATGTAALSLTGNDLSQTIQGNAGANALSGGGGADALLGLDGADTLTGGAGNDTFYFSTALGVANVDHITDFQNVSGDNDTMRLAKLVFAGLPTGTLTGDYFVANASGTATAGVSHAQIVYNTSTGALIYDSNGGGSGGTTQFAVIDNHASVAGTAISAADFFVA